MAPLKYITDPQVGCCTTMELINLTKANPKDKEDLVQWAREEMVNKGIVPLN